MKTSFFIMVPGQGSSTFVALISLQEQLKRFFHNALPREASRIGKFFQSLERFGTDFNRVSL